MNNNNTPLYEKYNTIIKSLTNYSTGDVLFILSNKKLDYEIVKRTNMSITIKILNSKDVHNMYNIFNKLDLFNLNLDTKKSSIEFNLRDINSQLILKRKSLISSILEDMFNKEAAYKYKDVNKTKNMNKLNDEEKSNFLREQKLRNEDFAKFNELLKRL